MYIAECFHWVSLERAFPSTSIRSSSRPPAKLQWCYTGVAEQGDLAVRNGLLLDSVDAWLLAEPKLVNGRKKSVYPAVVQRMKLAEGFTRRLQSLGLHRREKPVPSLQEYLAARAESE